MAPAFHQRTLPFRAAAQLKEQVIGTILSGGLEDGTTGLVWVKEYGGITIVQDPATAKCPFMPTAALQNGNIDYVLEPAAIAPLLRKLVSATRREHKRSNKRIL